MGIFLLLLWLRGVLDVFVVVVARRHVVVTVVGVVARRGCSTFHSGVGPSFGHESGDTQYRSQV